MSFLGVEVMDRPSNSAASPSKSPLSNTHSKINELPSYPMTNQCIGICVIINNEIYETTQGTGMYKYQISNVLSHSQFWIPCPHLSVYYILELY